MKRKLHFLCLTALLFLNSLNAASLQEPVIVEISDATLSNVYYDQTNFSVPTKLVFTNLTNVNGYIYFHQNTNLVAIDFPKLNQTKGYVYIYGNKDLNSVNTPNLSIIGDYLYVDSNTSLATFNICGLKEIKKTYTIQNNTSAIDALPFCFYQEAPQNLTLSNNTIEENSPIGTLIGSISADSKDPNAILTYSLKNNSNNLFKIIGNQLFANSTFDYETINQYKIKIAVRNQIGETTTKDFTITINDVKVEKFNVIEITDETLDNVIYHQVSFTEPTKLIFTNLTSIKGYIYFHQNKNLISVDFPVLTQTGSYIYVYENQSLETLKAPNLATIKEYLSVNGNKSLTELGICGLKEIQSPRNPSYDINNNTSGVDLKPYCFYKKAPQNITLSNSNISENLPSGSLIGDLSADGNDSKEILTYYLKNNSENSFKIIGKQLFANQSFDYEAKNQYKITVGVRNQIGEFSTKDFIINITDINPETINIIEITDTTLDNVYYHKANFTGPTKLVFTNLTSVKGYIYFYQNSNLIGVDFPELTQTGDYFFAVGNQSLENIKTPKLNTIKEYLYVEGNPKITELQICSLKEILPLEVSSTSYYYIKNNPQLDMNTTCLTNTVVSFTPADPIVLLPAPNTLVGTFSSDSSDAINYFFVDENGNPTVNANFTIIKDKLYLTNEYNTYTEKDFIVNIAGIRTSNGSNTNKSSKTTLTKSDSKLNEKLQLSISFNIGNNTLGVKTDEIKENKIIIYPNPSKDIFEIQSEENITEVQLFDMIGRQLKNLKITNKSVDVSNIKTGNYLLLIKTNNTLSTHKIIIIK